MKNEIQVSGIAASYNEDSVKSLMKIKVNKKNMMDIQK